MRSCLPATTVLVALACCSQAIASDSPSVDQVKAMLETGQQPIRIVCFGDSVTGVYYHTGGRRAWPDMLGIALKKQFPKAKLDVFNAGVSGNTTGAALARIDHDVMARKPHLVVVMFGLNDIVRGNPPEYRDNLRTIIRRCRDSEAAVVLCTLNSVYRNDARPMSAVAEFSQIVRKLAREESVPLADCFRAYEDVRSKSPTDWMLLMSEDIHPCMSGHKLFAETVARTITGEQIALADVPPPADALRFTLTRLKAGQPVHIIATPPYDEIIRDVLKELFPNAQLHVTAWPVKDRSLDAMVEWAKGIRAQKPNLVLLSVPADAAAKDEETFIRTYNWILSWSAAYDSAQWDVLPILPTVTAQPTPGQLQRVALAQKVIAGVDVEYVDRKTGDVRSPRELLRDWIQRAATRCLSTP